MSEAAGARPGSPAAILPVMTTLINSGPAYIPSLLTSHAPFRRPSSLPSSELNKFLARLSSKIVSGGAFSTERALMQSIATEIVKMDEEGVVIGMYGRVWVQHLFAGLSVSRTCLSVNGSSLIALYSRPPQPKLCLATSTCSSSSSCCLRATQLSIASPSCPSSSKSLKPWWLG